MIRNLSTEDVRALFGVGVGVWLVATVVLWIGGSVLLDPGAPLIVFGVFVVVVPAMILLTFAAFIWREIRPAARPAAAILLVLPGMLLDVVMVSFFGTFFPNLEQGSVRYFAGLLLLAYGTVLLVGLFSRSR